MAAPGSSAGFRYEMTVRFGEVDHAGIVYYPRFFHYFHIAFEEAFGPGEYRRLLDERRLGFPAVRVECDFRRPLRFGDRVAVVVTAERIGARSVTLRYTVSRADAPETPCAIGRVTCAAVELDGFRAVPLPDDLRRLFASLA